MVSKGYKDLLHIGNQSRPYIFDLEIQIPDVLYTAVLEVDEQVGPCFWSFTRSCEPWRKVDNGGF